MLPQALSVHALALPLAIKGKLVSRGFRTLRDIHAVTPAQLARDCGLSTAEAAGVVSTASAGASDAGGPLLPGSVTALDLLDQERSERRVITFCKELDGLLKGGIGRGHITEICGAPGVGKTQFGMQLALNVQIPHEMGGVGGHAIYVDTEGSFSADRIEQMAAALRSHLASAAKHSSAPAQHAAASQVSVHALLSAVHVFRVHSSTEQVALGHALSSFLEGNPRVKLLVLDSVAFHFRHGFDDYGARTRALLAHALVLLKCAARFGIALVLVNQVTTKVGGEGSEGGTIAPALGETWAHVANLRLMLTKSGARGGETERTALVDKGSAAPRTPVPFRIGAEGVRSVRRGAKRALDDLAPPNSAIPHAVAGPGGDASVLSTDRAAPQSAFVPTLDGVHRWDADDSGHGHAWSGCGPSPGVGGPRPSMDETVMEQHAGGAAAAAPLTGALAVQPRALSAPTVAPPGTGA